MIDLQIVRDPYKFYEVNDVALIKSENNISDALTKLETESILLEIILHGKNNRSYEQWVTKTKLDYNALTETKMLWECQTS